MIAPAGKSGGATLVKVCWARAGTPPAAARPAPAPSRRNASRREQSPRFGCFGSVMAFSGSQLPPARERSGFSVHRVLRRLSVWGGRPAGYNAAPVVRSVASAYFVARVPAVHEEVAIVKRTMRSTVVLGVAGAVWLLAGAGGVGVSAQGSGEQAAAVPDAGDWPMYRGDAAGTGFSPLDGITAANVADLAEAWTYPLAAVDEGARGPNSQATPIVVDGVMYLPAADRVVALDAATGREIWRHALDGARPSRRGVAWWAGRGRHGTRASSSPPGSTCARSTRPPGSRSRASAGAAPSTWSCPTTRCPSCTATWSSSAPTPPPAPSAASGTRAPSTRAPAPRCGNSARSRSPASRGTTPGAVTVGRAGSGPTRGPSTSPWMSSAGTCTCRWRPPSPATTAAIGPATTCTATPSSPWTSPPASTGGTSRPSTTTCGTPIRRPRPPCSTSPATAARSPPSG